MARLSDSVNFFINHSALLKISKPKVRTGASKQIGNTRESLTCFLVKIPKANKPSNGP
jgi:hypothetical protein